MLKVLKKVVSLLTSVALAVALSYIITRYIFILATVPTGSMEPTIHQGDRIFISLIGKYREIKQNDLVVFKAPPDIGQDILLVKRVIAVGNDSVKIDKGKVYVNDNPLQEDYVTYEDTLSMPPYIVPEGELFVLGDNRVSSFDSRYWRHKSIPLPSIKGVVGF